MKSGLTECLDVSNEPPPVPRVDENAHLILCIVSEHEIRAVVRRSSTASISPCTVRCHDECYHRDGDSRRPLAA